MDSVIIIGKGKVGGSIAQALLERSTHVSVVGRKELADREHEIWTTLDASLNRLTLVIVAVPDGEITGVAEQLSNVLPSTSNIIVVHTAGAHTESLLHPLASTAIRIGSMHPFQTFPVVAANLLRDVPWGVRGDEQTRAVLETFVQHLDGRAIEIQGGEREQALYHATAVMASNFQHVLYDAAVKMAEQLNIEATELLPTIVRTTADVAMQSLKNTGKNITGPAARGDKETIEKHLEVLNVVPEVRAVYEAMTAYITELIHAQHTNKHDDK